MKKIVLGLSAVAIAVGVAGAAAPASAQPFVAPPYYHHHYYRPYHRPVVVVRPYHPRRPVLLCNWYRHHRVCYWAWVG